MPVYKYECKKCNLNLEVVRPVSKRDDLVSLTLEYCPVHKSIIEDKTEKAKDTGEIWSAMMFVSNQPDNDGLHCDGCSLKRCVTSGSFKI